MKRAPERIERIVLALLREPCTNLVLLDPEPRAEVNKILRNGELASVAVRDLLRDHASQVFETPPDPNGKYIVEMLHVMLPEVREQGVRKKMYVKFVLIIDEEDESCSQITIIRFHKASGSQPITRFPKR